jgi:hypothetical protein
LIQEHASSGQPRYNIKKLLMHEEDLGLLQKPVDDRNLKSAAMWQYQRRSQKKYDETRCMGHFSDCRVAKV